LENANNHEGRQTAQEMDKDLENNDGADFGREESDRLTKEP